MWKKGVEGETSENDLVRPFIAHRLGGTTKIQNFLPVEFITMEPDAEMIHVVMQVVELVCSLSTV